MSKRLLFIGVVVLLVSSAASAGVGWDLAWFWGPTWGFSTPYSQWQNTYVTAGNGVVQYGSGTTSNYNGGTAGGTQTSSVGTQSSNVLVGQYSSITGNSPASFGVAGSVANVTASQYQASW
jgi:hypothetical protein